MPSILIYADDKDFKTILDYLNGNEEVAFFVSDGPKRWRATKTIPCLDQSSIRFWHVPNGPLPLVHPPSSKQVDFIDDPWNGWTELRAGADTSCPYFDGHTGIFTIKYQPQAQRVPGGIGLSSFSWIGNRYTIAGSPPAPKCTEKFWQSLSRWVKKCAKKIPRTGPLNGPKAEIWAFPSALAAFRSGKGRDSNPPTS